MNMSVSSLLRAVPCTSFAQFFERGAEREERNGVALFLFLKKAPMRHSAYNPSLVYTRRSYRSVVSTQTSWEACSLRYVESRKRLHKFRAEMETSSTPISMPQGSH